MAAPRSFRSRACAICSILGPAPPAHPSPDQDASMPLLARSRLLVVALVALALAVPTGRALGTGRAARPGPAPAAAAAADVRTAAKGRPNIVVVMADDMRVDDLRWAPHVRRLIGRQGV